jgi:P2 family phage contractile tail tube protein
MVVLGKVLKGFNLFVDGKGHRGRLPQLVLPKLIRELKDYTSGGIDGAPIQIDMGMGKLELEFTIVEMNGGLVGEFGARDISQNTYRAKGSIKSETDVKEYPVEVVMRGRINEIDMGTWKASEPGETKYKATLVYLELIVEGVVKLKYDKLNNVHMNEDGVDLLADRYANLE